MIKKFGAFAIYVLGGILLIYSASRSYNFLALTLPPDKQFLAFAGLAALDGGLIAWTLMYMGNAKGWQRMIALVMALIDLSGAIWSMHNDTVYTTGAAGLTHAMSAAQIENAVFVLSAIIGANVFATVVYHLADPEQLRQQAEEEAFDKVESATLKQISKNADTLAAQLAPIMANDWMEQTAAKYLLKLGADELPKNVIDVKAQDVAAAAPKTDFLSRLRTWRNPPPPVEAIDPNKNNNGHKT